MGQNYLESLLKYKLLGPTFNGYWVSLRICISYTFPDDSHELHLRITEFNNKQTKYQFFQKRKSK